MDRIVIPVHAPKVHELSNFLNSIRPLIGNVLVVATDEEEASPSYSSHARDSLAGVA